MPVLFSIAHSSANGLLFFFVGIVPQSAQYSQQADTADVSTTYEASY